MYTLLYLEWITNKDLRSTQCYVAAWRGGEFGGQWIHVYVGLSPFSVHLKQSQHLSSYTPIQKFKRNKDVKFYSKLLMISPNIAKVNRLLQVE